MNEPSKEALEAVRNLLCELPVGAGDGDTCVYRVPSNKDIALALDRFRAEEVEGKDRELEQLKAANSILREMADAAEQWYWANNRAFLDTVGSKERVFDALRLLGRYPPSKDIVEPLPGDQP